MNTHNNHREFAEILVANAPLSKAYGPKIRVAVGIDENLGAGIHEMLRALIRSQKIDLCFPLWNERRHCESGETLTVEGGATVGVVDGIDFGHRIDNDSCPDDHVVAKALAYLSTYRSVFILSADCNGEVDGLRYLLNQRVAKVLNRDLSHGLSLVLLGHRPRTTALAYEQAVFAALSAPRFGAGFSEHFLPG